MPQLTVTKTYKDGTTLTESQLDGIKTSLEAFFNTTKIDSSNIQSGGIATTNIANNAITGALLNSDVVDNSSLQLTGNQLSIKPSGITTPMIAASAVTRPCMASVGQQISSSSSNTYSNNTTTYSAVPGLSVTITTTGRPVIVGLQSDGSGNVGWIEAFTNSGTAAQARLQILRGSTVIVSKQISASIGVSNTSIDLIVPVDTIYIDPVAAGTYTYTVQMADLGNGTGHTVDIRYAVLFAFEL